jgi:nitrite reductase (NO-forming)/hydroxylamine reductase
VPCFDPRREKMKKTVVGMLTMTAMAFAMGSAFAQDAAKAPEMTAAEKEQSKKIYY